MYLIPLKTYNFPLHVIFIHLNGCPSQMPYSQRFNSAQRASPKNHRRSYIYIVYGLPQLAYKLLDIEQVELAVIQQRTQRNGSQRMRYHGSLTPFLLRKKNSGAKKLLLAPASPRQTLVELKWFAETEGLIGVNGYL